MKNRKYAVDRNGLTVQMPFSTATVGWKSLAIIIAFVVLLAAVFVFVAVAALRLLILVAVVGLVVYAWSKIRRLGGSPPGADQAARRPAPTPTRVGGGEEEFPS